jgi:hypothetical protein
MNKPEIKSGLLNAKSSAAPTNKITREELAKQLKKRRERDEEIVTGIFKNLENPSSNGGRGAVVFSYKFYHGQPNEVYELVDGERYALPRGVARHLNNNCYYKEYTQQSDDGVRGAINPDGRLKSKNALQLSRKVHRYAFHSLEYMDDDIDMYPADLVEVTYSP